MKDGQAIFNVRPGGAQVVNLAASRSQPVTLDRARPAIEQFLLNERKRKLIADDLQALARRRQDRVRGRLRGDAKRRRHRPASAPELPPLTTLACDAACLRGDSGAADRRRSDRFERSVDAQHLDARQGLKGLK